MLLITHINVNAFSSLVCVTYLTSALVYSNDHQTSHFLVLLNSIKYKNIIVAKPFKTNSEEI